MPQQLYIITKSVKDLLKLFDEEAVLENLVISDTQHPFSGFVNESILPQNPTVRQVLKFDYDFRGLVHFSANIGSVRVQLSGREGWFLRFNISSSAKTLSKMEALIRELGIYTPGRYKIRYD